MPTRRALLTGFRTATPVEIGDHCLAKCFVHCRTCGDACAEQAIRFTPRIGGPPLPSILAERCTRCGACAATCPANAMTIMQETAHA
jgi:ferredoxin-type protein NapF